MLRALVLCVSVLAVAEAGRAPAQQPVAAPRQPTYWCPMHPDERASSAIACPICKMTMVPIPAMRVGEYRMDVASIAASSGRGLRGLRVTLREPGAAGAVVPALDIVHEKPLHLFVISRDLEFFRHLHPETYTSGPVEFRMDIPPGEYMVIADFLPPGGTPQLVQRLIVVPGGSARPVGSPRTAPAFGVSAGVRAQIISTTGLTAGQDSIVRIALTDSKSAGPIQDLEPYLGSDAHMVLVNAALTEAVHAHPEERDRGSNDLTFDVTLPVAGAYKGWLQFQRAGTVVTIPLGLIAR